MLRRWVVWPTGRMLYELGQLVGAITPENLRRLATRAPELVEVFLAVTLVMRGFLGVTRTQLTATPIEPFWAFYVWILIGIFQLGAVLANDGKWRCRCSLAQFFIWSGISAQFAFIRGEVPTAFPIMSVFSVVAYLQVRVALRAAAAQAARPERDVTSEKYVELYVDQLQRLILMWSSSAAVGIITIGEDSVIRYANPGAHALFRYEWGALLGRPLTDLMPEALRPRHLAGIRRYVETGQRTFSWRDLEFDAVAADGSTVPITLTFIEHRLSDDRMFTGVMQRRPGAADGATSA
jgi:PAS domain S-box-containing protein